MFCTHFDASVGAAGTWMRCSLLLQLLILAAATSSAMGAASSRPKSEAKPTFSAVPPSSDFEESTKVTRNPLPAVRHESIISTIGATPLVRLNHMAPEGVNVYVKVEAFNPMGSVKDRLALGMIEYAEQHGLLKPGQTVVEASSGNTGLGLAMVCASKGYPFVCVMSEAFSIERRKMMRFLGARVILTNPAHKFGGMLQTLMALKEQHGWYWPNQFENEANAWIHRQTTGPEIVEAMAGSNFDWFVCAYGTGGTLKGVGQVRDWIATDGRGLAIAVGLRRMARGLTS